MTQTETTIDVSTENHGSLFRFNIHTEAAQAWVDENVDAPGYLWMGKSFHVEPRYAEPIVQGMIDAGLEVN